MCLAKPAELLALYDGAPPLFVLIREAFQVPDRHALNLASVERGRSETEELATTAAMTLHYTQSMRLLATPNLRVRITSIVNTSACLHSMLSALAGECGERRTATILRQGRDKIGIAASAVAATDLAGGGGNKYMQ